MLLDLYIGFATTVWWSGIPFSLRIFRSFVIHTVKDFSMINDTEVDNFLEFPSFLHDPKNVGNLISGSSAFPKCDLCIWKVSVHILLKPSSKDFEHYIASTWNEYNCVVAWTFFSIALLWDRNENWLFLVLWQQLSFQICSHIHIDYSS